MTNRFHSLTCIGAGAIALLAATSVMAKGKPIKEPPPAPPISYDVTWLDGSTQFDRFNLHDVNGSGSAIAGTGYIGDSPHAITMDVISGAVTDLNDLVAGLDSSLLPSGWQPSWQLASANRVSATGKIAGHILDDQGQRRLYTYDPNALAPLSVFGELGTYQSLQDMNNAGDVLYAQNLDGVTTHHIHTNAGQTLNLNPSLSRASALNDDQVVVGTLPHPDSKYLAAYTYDVAADTLTMIPPFFQAIDINNGGVVAGGGELTDQGNPFIKAVHYTAEDGKWLLDEDGSNSWATDINDAGQSAGRISIRDRKVPDTSFLYDPIAGFWSLNDLLQDTIEDTSIWFTRVGFFDVSEVVAMSEPLDTGYPLMVGMKSSRAFMLTPFVSSAASATPIPEPSTGIMLLLASGGLSLLVRRREARR